MKPYFGQGASSVYISKQSDVASIDALALLWARRHHARYVEHRSRPLTQQDIAMDITPQQFSDTLDYIDKLLGEHGWTHRTCFQVAKDSVSFAQATSEYYAIVNLYSQFDADRQEFYRKKLIDMGYPQDVVHSVPLMSAPSEVEYVDE